VGDVPSGIVAEQSPVASAGAKYGFTQPTKPYEQVSSKVAMSEDRETSALESEAGDDGLTLFSTPTFENQQTAISDRAQIPRPGALDGQANSGRSNEEMPTLDKTSIFGRAKRALTRTGGLEADQATISKGVSVLETVESGPAPILAGEPDREEDALEIPAFLRRQSR